jgi:hypothetical protein
VIHLNDQPICMTASPKLEKPPTTKCKQKCGNHANKAKRLQMLNEKLRLVHTVDGANDKICEEYTKIFKLPRDSLTATTAAEHTNPTPTIPKGRAITLKNYRLPEAQQQEIKRQVTQMLDDIITPSNSGWNFPLQVVPKKKKVRRIGKTKMENLCRL